MKLHSAGLAALSLAIALGLSACGSSPQPADYQAEQPAMDFRGYFSGPVQAHGMFTDRSGRVVKRFTVAMQGRWSGDSGVLEEDFTYSNGEKERRVWQLKDLGGGRFEGRAADIVGREQHVRPRCDGRGDLRIDHRHAGVKDAREPAGDQRGIGPAFANGKVPAHVFADQNDADPKRPDVGGPEDTQKTDLGAMRPHAVHRR